jgi:hypothetical protein
MTVEDKHMRCGADINVVDLSDFSTACMTGLDDSRINYLTEMPLLTSLSR